MSSAYQHLALAEVRPGMVLSDVLLDQQGQVLLPQGAVLTAAIIALLPRHGIDMLAVLRSDAAPAPAPTRRRAHQRAWRTCSASNDTDNQRRLGHRPAAPLHARLSARPGDRHDMRRRSASTTSSASWRTCPRCRRW